MNFSFLYFDNLNRSEKKKELDNREWERMGQRTNERWTHCCVVCKRACMDFEELGIGLQQLFGLKCLRSDLVFIVMYLLFVFFFLFAFLFYRLFFWQVTACTNSRLSELEIWKVFNINPSSCNLIVLLLFLTISLLHTFFSDKLLTLHYCFFFFKYPSSGMMCQLVNVLFVLFVFIQKEW